MPPEPDSPSVLFRRILWGLIAVLMLVAVVQLWAAHTLREKTQHWLQQRGLDFQVSYLRVSLLDLRVIALGVKAENAEGRGFSAREVMLDYSWWQLLRGRVHLPKASVSGAYMDLQSTPGQLARIWEVGGWNLGGGKGKDRDLELSIDWARIRDSEICYLHKPIWPTATCASIGDLHTDNFQLDLWRKGDMPLHVDIDVGNMQLHDLLAWEKGITPYNTVIGSLHSKTVSFLWPSLQTGADELNAEYFSGCPPQRWADAIQGLQRLIGHCAAARHLQAEGNLKFEFGRKALARWQQLNGEDVVLRRSDQRWQDWRATKISISNFDFLRPMKRLQWQRGYAEAFDWCPRHLRNTNSHLCLRAGDLSLSQATVFDWTHRLKINTGASAISRGYLLDMAQPRPNPLKAEEGLFGPLQFDAVTRVLSFEHLAIESANGCVPSELWQKPDYCVAMQGLQSSEQFDFRFGSEERDISWGLSSGPLQLAQFSIGAKGQPQAKLRELRWQAVDTIARDSPLSIQDFFLQSLSGCLPRDFLPTTWQPLCARVNSFAGRGHFAWQRGEEGYAILGQLRLQRLLLNDSGNAGEGLLLQQLQTGESLIKRKVADNPWVVSTPLPGIPAGVGADSSGAEKGKLNQQDDEIKPDTGDLALAMIEIPNLKIKKSALKKLDGCLTEGWVRLIYRGSQEPDEMPVCFNIRELHQKAPLLLAWQHGIDLLVEEVTVARALAKTADEKTLLDLSGIKLPLVRVRHHSLPEALTYVALPGASASNFNSCFPGKQEFTLLEIHCTELGGLSLGEYFYLYSGAQYASANMDNSAIEKIKLVNRLGIATVDIAGVIVPELEILWSQKNSVESKISLKNIAADTLTVCLAKLVRSDKSLPACVFGRNFHSVGQSGWSIDEIEFKKQIKAVPLWQMGSISTERMAFSSDTLNFYGLNIDGILFCGLRTFFPEDRSKAGIADCIETQQLSFKDISVKLGLNKTVPQLKLGRLTSQPIAFWQKDVNFLQAGLQKLSWQSFSWDSGVAFTISALDIQNIRVCTQESGLTVTVSRLARAIVGDSYHCFGVDRVSMPGLQKIDLSNPWSVQGSIQLAGLSIPRKNMSPVKIPKLEIDDIAIQGESLAQASGARGCLPAGLVKDAAVAPCYELGAFSVGKVESSTGAGGRRLILSGIRFNNVQLHEKNFPQDLPLKLLSVSGMTAGQLYIDRQGVDFKALEFDDISGCFPSGYLDDGDHCFAFTSLLLEGTLRRGKGAELSTLRINDIVLLSPRGEELVQGQSIILSQLQITNTGIRFESGEAVHFHFFERSANSLEFDRHNWIGDFKYLWVEEFSYYWQQKILDVGFIDFLRPRFILLRDLSRKLPIINEINELRGFVGVDTWRRNENTLPFLYHIGDIYLKHGTFTWVDHQDEFRARLPVRDINFNLSDLSNLAEHPPAMLVVNGRPGGFGELQIGGTIDYLGDKKWDADLTGYFSSVNLIPATPYMAKLLGFKILQGQADAVVNIQVNENELNGFADIKLEKLKVRRVRKDDQLPVKSTFVPLNIALWLLKDGQGNIKFAMPVSGNIRDPKFSFSFVFSELLQKAVIDALVSYFTPYGIYLLAKFAWGRFTVKSFDAVDFEPGSAKLNNLALAQLQRMVVILNEHPDTRPGVCGISNARDWQALQPYAAVGLSRSRRILVEFYRNPSPSLRDELEKLAMARSREVEKYLIDAGIQASELISCAPDYIGRDFGDPRVEFSN
ncbi:DUF748 domain-containing protein [Microbulbifer sp. OS29]|uniref:DUF748 domain-containing protein n=1 Tax=Microbulbifer okhotskensis TaxID=2926617 RepID=A0A9X2EMT3_9GAMM|nr:DUF748 domain-containing protein [Microbulbifer okhotskensis]MCO1334616.1 DUF748 domain-containing protein [Microbulbifer okhotskensis]